MSDDVDLSVVGELLALVAHDLRNPLSALHSNLGFLESLLPRDDRDLMEAIEDGVVSCEGLNHIIGNLDLLGQALRGIGATPSARLPVLELVHEVLSLTQQVAKSHGVTLKLRADSVAVDADLRRDLSTRSLANLVRNSIQHAGPTKSVEIGVRATADTMAIVVTDDGPRVRDADGDLIFTARGQIAAKTMQNGRYSRGLGLYCAQVAASADGWSVRFEQSDDGMNAFVLERPLLTFG